jgi:hypothetical protein
MAPSRRVNARCTSVQDQIESGLSRAQFVPNTPRTCGHSRLIRSALSFAFRETA